MKKRICLFIFLLLFFFIVGCGEKETFKISYELDGGILSDPIEEFVADEDISLPVPQKEGYDFKGWYESENLVIDLENRDYTLRAKWEIKTFTITYDLDGGQFKKDPVTTFTYDEKVALPEPEKEGFAFLGWYDGEKYVAYAMKRDYNLVAKWSVYPFVINYDLDGGQYEDQLVTEYLKNQEVKLPIPSKEGFVFAGWYQNDEKITKIVKGCYDLKAKWVKDEGQFANLSFESLEIFYDGKEHSLEVTGLNSDLEVVYSHSNIKNSGVYEITALVTYKKELVKEYKATLKINKLQGEISYDPQNEFIYEGKVIKFSPTINNNEQTIFFDNVHEFRRYGVYTVTFWANESTNYLAVEPVTITFNICSNPYKIYFDSQKFQYDGTVKTLKYTGELPEGFTVTYENNNQTEPGKYEVVAIFTCESDDSKSFELNAILEIDKQDDAEFEKYLDEMLVAIFEGDQLSINFFFKDYTLYGIEHLGAELPKAFEGDYEEDMQEIRDIIDELHSFNYDKLSNDQRYSYEILDRYFNYIVSITEEMSYMTNSYLGSYLGKQSNLPLELAEYKFYTEQDVKDYICYLEDAPEAFESYYNFTVKQADMGYGLPDHVIDSVISQCEKFVEIKDENYLIDIFNLKIDNLDFLSEQQKQEYKEKAKEGVQGPLTDAYQYIADNMASLKGKSVNYGGLYNYEGGSEYYMIMLRDVLGYKDLTKEEAISYIDKKLEEANNNINKVVKNYQGMIPSDQEIFYEAAVNGKPNFSNTDIYDLLDEFRYLAYDYVPKLNVMPNIEIKLVDKSLQDNFSPACYFVSPLDVKNKESIYINPKYLNDYNYIFTTLAHEGYPGHLYQYSYAKELDISNLRKVLRNSGYTEGWATYVELTAYNFCLSYDSEPLQTALDYCYYNQIVNGLLTVRLDMGIHLEGWTMKDAASFMSNLLGYSYKEEDIKDFYEQLVEVPTNSSEYFYAFCLIEDMKTKAMNELGLYFDIVEFNKTILDCGALPLELIEEEVLEYINEVKYIYNIK